jgi:REP element-mobilizing transposase RayT
LYKFGPATKTNERRSLAHDPHDAQQRSDAKQALKYPPVRFNEEQRQSIGRGIARTCEESDIAVHACAIGHDHVHAVIARHAKSVERIVGQMEGRAGQQMRAENCHPLNAFATDNGAPPTPWAEGCWSVFINDRRQLVEAIDYVSRHPQKEGLPPQTWGFVAPA